MPTASSAVKLKGMRTTIDLPGPLLDNAKRRAAELDVTLSEVVQDGLRMILNARPAESKRKFELLTVGGPRDPQLTWEKISALVAEDEEQELVRKLRP
jgi:hypothetical protein